jgi:RNA polymerase sigma factor (sigma-70 family)
LSLNPLEHTQWFTEELQPHEAALRAWLYSRFPSLTDQDDIVQETYARILRAREAGNIRSPKALLFATARNAAIDVFRRKRVAGTQAITEFGESAVLESRPNAREVVNQQQEFEILTEAILALPARCRQIMTLRYMEELSYKEIAVRLDISPETVKVQIAKGMRRCAEYFQERGLLPSSPPEK